MDWRYAAIYTGLALVTLYRAWPTPGRAIASAILANVILTNLAMMTFVPDEGTTFVNAFGELMILMVAAASLLDAPRVAGVIIMLSTISCTRSLSYSFVTDKPGLHLYEEFVNGILIAQMLIVMNTGVLGVVIRGSGRFIRWCRHRRRASNAGVRMRLAAGAPPRKGPSALALIFRRNIPPPR